MQLATGAGRVRVWYRHGHVKLHQAAGRNGPVPAEGAARRLVHIGALVAVIIKFVTRVCAGLHSGWGVDFAGSGDGHTRGEVGAGCKLKPKQSPSKPTYHPGNNQGSLEFNSPARGTRRRTERVAKSRKVVSTQPRAPQSLEPYLRR